MQYYTATNDKKSTALYGEIFSLQAQALKKAPVGKWTQNGPNQWGR